MTKKAFKLLLPIQAKNVSWFIGIYAFIMAILLIVFYFVPIDDTSWIPDSIINAPKIYLLVMGIVYPLTVTKLYVSQGLTRKQFFLAYTGVMCIISLLLLIPIIVTVIYYDSFSLTNVITHYLQMPLFFLIGWTSVIGFQIRKWYPAVLGILGAIAMFQILIIPEILSLPEMAVLGSTILLLALLILVLPHIFSKVTLKI